MLREKGNAGSLVILDLGLGVNVMIAKSTFTSEGCGTDPMMAPEVWLCDGLRKTNKVDVFSSAMTLLEYVFGSDAFSLLSQCKERDGNTGALFTPEKLRGLLKKHFDKFWKVPSSDEMIDLLLGMTKTNPDERLSAEEWLNHQALSSVPDPLEEGEDVPTSDPQDNEDLESAIQRAADAEEKAAVLKAENDELKTKIAFYQEGLKDHDDDVDKEKEKTAKLEAELSELKKKLEMKNDATDKTLGVEERLAGMQLDVATAAVAAGGANDESKQILHLESTIMKLNGDTRTLASYVVCLSNPLSFAQFTALFDEESSTSFVDAFFDNYNGGASKYGCLFAFTASFNSAWKCQFQKKRKAGGDFTAVDFMNSYSARVDGMTDSLSSGRAMFEKFKKVTNYKKNGSVPNINTHKGEWKNQAEAVSKEISVKLTNDNIDHADDFASALAICKRVVDQVFNKRVAQGFNLVPKSYRDSFATLIATIHITNGTEFGVVEG